VLNFYVILSQESSVILMSFFMILSFFTLSGFYCYSLLLAFSFTVPNLYCYSPTPFTLLFVFQTILLLILCSLSLALTHTI